MKIYTKTGDDGSTSLYGGTRISKADLRMDAIGTVDELNAQIGLLRDQPVNADQQHKFQTIQENLFVIGAMLASEKKESNIPVLSEDSIRWIEQGIDEMVEGIPPMRFFILPGGHPAVSMAHIARCVCRRAERTTVRLSQEVDMPASINVYLNRLSDYLFILARDLGQKLKVEEIPWKASRD